MFQYPLRVECYCKLLELIETIEGYVSFNTLYGSSVTASG